MRTRNQSKIEEAEAESSSVPVDLEEAEEPAVEQPTSNQPVEEDEDDAVEEVKGSAAREEILEQIKKEEKEALKSKKKKKKRKPRKVAEPVADEEEDDDDDLDEEFFAELEQMQAKKDTAKKAKKPKGKHTTFVVDEEEITPSEPRDVDHNIQVVVLPDERATVAQSAILAIPTEELSSSALIYSRSNLVDGVDHVGKGVKRKKNSPKRVDTSWKRSRKMSLLSSGKSRFHRRGGRGKPAVNFVTR